MRWTFTFGLAVALMVPQLSTAQAVGQITGAVTSEAGAPISGAQVVASGRGAVTGANGRFSISGVPVGRHTVRATSVGYSEGTTQVTVAAGQTATANIQLAARVVQLEEIVAVGYGTARRRDVTGSIASVTGEQLSARAAPTSAVSNALQGKAPGVQVITNSGTPGAGASVRIRGSNSISANSEPLYVIDGIPAAQGTRSTDPTQNPLNTIDPSNIESIQVLKDASATAIYGARGANGVVLVTTRRGRAGQNRVSVETSYGVQTPTDRINPLTGPQFRELVNEAYVNAGRARQYTDAQISSAPTYNYADLMMRNAPQQSHSLTFSGGGEQTRFLVGGNYVDQEGILINSGFHRYGARANLDSNLTERFRMGSSVSVTRVQQDLNRTESGGIGAGANGILAAINFDPTLPPYDDQNRPNLKARLGEQLDNPYLNALLIENPRRVTRLLGNAYGELDVTDAIRLRSTFGANLGFERTPQYQPIISPAGSGNNGNASVYSNQGVELTSETTANYRREMGPGSLDVLGGFSAQTSRFEDQFSAAFNFPSDQFKWNNLGVGKVRSGLSTNAVDWTLLSYLGRANYNLLDRYIFTVTGRRDGSSRFGAENKWAFFPSAAFAWRAIDEPFMQDQGLFSDLKVRLSYGVTGNQAIEEYQSLARLSTEFVAIGRGGEAVTLAPSGAAANPGLKWETQRQFNVGADFGFLDNRLTLTMDAYQSNTSDLLLRVPLPRMSGFSSQLQNVGSVRNRGVELGINTVNFEGDRFTWLSTLNVSANRNEVIDLGGVSEISPGNERYGHFIGSTSSHIVRVGESLGSMYGYRVDGLFQQGDACYLKNATLCAPGEYKVADLDNDGVITQNDRTIIGNAQPDLYGGFTNNMTFGAVTLDAFFNFSIGNDVANLNRVFTELVTGFLNEDERVLNRWTPTNTNTSVPRANNARPRLFYSSMVEDGSYLRLQNLTLGYRLPSQLLPGVDGARLFLTGQNLFLLTEYTGFDPEVNSIGGDARFSGVDIGAFPRARSWNVGMNVTF
ncbi:MAG: TonB-dependent receptor [Gemmatimonadetes bacterium]|nr:TonB-dependent receptor [Gemmatimonadota bacterium]